MAADRADAVLAPDGDEYRAVVLEHSLQYFGAGAYSFTEPNPLVGGNTERSSEMRSGGAGTAHSLFEIGTDSISKDDVSHAILAFEAAVRLDAKHGPAWRALGMAHLSDEQRSAAIAAFTYAHDAFGGTDGDTLLSLALSLPIEQQKGQILDTLARWMALSPLFGSHLSPSVVAALDRSTLGTAFGLHPDDEALLAREFCKGVEDAASAAERSFSSPRGPREASAEDRAAVLEDHAAGIADVLTVAGLVAAIFLDLATAERHLRRALDLRPDDVVLWAKLGYILCTDQKYDQAITCCDRALQLRETCVGARITRGIALVDYGNADEALLEFLAAIAITEQKHEVPFDFWNYVTCSCNALERNPRTELLEKLADAQNLEGFRLAGLVFWPDGRRPLVKSAARR